MTPVHPDACDTPGNANPPLDAAGIARQVAVCLEDLQEQAGLGAGSVLVVGASSSEIIGHRIGTATSLEVGQAVVSAVLAFSDKVGCEVAFQCCEHLNRALVVTRRLQAARGWAEVTAIPVPGAGGAVAAKAFALLPDACLVAEIEADAGIDIGDTLVGMHLKRVAVPVRGRLREIGRAHVVMARTRPPLIGGERAVYRAEEAARRLG